MLVIQEPSSLGLIPSRISNKYKVFNYLEITKQTNLMKKRVFLGMVEEYNLTEIYKEIN